MLARLLTACYELFLKRAVSFLVIGFVVLTGLTAGIVTGDAVEVITQAGMAASLAIGALGFIVMCLCGATPLLAPAAVAVSGVYAYRVGARIPMLRPAVWTQWPGALLCGAGAVLSLCALCAAGAVALSAAAGWMRGLSIPVRERAARLAGQYALTGIFWALYALGTLMAGFIY